MSESIAILIPVLGRPARVEPLVESIEQAARAIPCTPYFICSPQDAEELAEVERVQADHDVVLIVAPWEPGRGDYARKINEGFRLSPDSFVLTAADDLVFHPGWAERGLATWYETGACVIGTNDLANPRVKQGLHSTHSLVRREYAECGTVDEDDKLLHEGYFHNFCDCEFVDTAIWRGTFAMAMDCYVEHLHPTWRTAENDATYDLGRRRYQDDQTLYQARKQLWRKGRAVT